MAYEAYKAYLSVVKSTPSEYYKDYYNEFVNENFSSTTTYEEVLHNGTKINVRVVGIFSKESPTRRMENHQKIIFKDETYVVNIGDIFVFDDSNWLCIDVSTTSVSKSCVVAKAMYQLNLHKSGILYKVPACVESSIRLYSMSLDETKYISQLEDNIIVRISNNDITSSIQINDIYKIGKWNYKVTNLSDIIEPGLLLLKMQIVAEQQEIHVYTIEILNTSPLTITTLQTAQLEVSVFDNGEIVLPLPLLTFTSSNNDICEVDGSGLITPKEEGNVTITVNLANDDSVSDSIEVTVQDIVVDSYTLDVIGDSEIFLGDTVTIRAKVFNNGVEDSTKILNWELIDNDGYVTVVNQDNRSITLQASDNMNYKNKTFIVYGKLFDDASVFDDLTITLISLF